MPGLTEGQLAAFHDDGYLVVDDVVDAATRHSLHDEYAAILDRVAADLAAAGGLSSEHPGLAFGRRYTAMLAEVADMYDVYQHLDICLPLVEDLAPDASMNTGPAVFELVTHPGLLDVVESVIGPEILSNPVQHARIKPPAATLPAGATDANIAATMWHQDQAVLEADAAATDMLTVWVAITDATVDNGCLVAVPGSHRRDLTLHCPGTVFPAEIYIPEALIDPADVRSLPVAAGGVVLLHRRTEHGSLDNRTGDIRWSFDLRYQPPGQPTGRPYFPSFLARSAARPEDVVADPGEWAGRWFAARDRIVAGDERLRIGELWSGNAGDQLCA